MLAAMERGYTVGKYLELVQRLHRAIPGLALSTDIIVGFYGEDENDFEATLALMREVGFDSAFTFKYSVREHTRAYRLGDSVSEAEKARRLSAVIALQESIALARNQAEIGKVRDVLVEGPARRGGGMLAGKTPHFKTAVFPGTPAMNAGDTLAVRIVSASSHSLTGIPA
jgi:tRNA-2-methylthio-N6-dimethylallyladenosine synthase